MGRILFGIYHGWGQFTPTIGIAQALQDRGHTVAYAAHPVYKALLANAGLELLAGFSPGETTLRSHEAMRNGRSLPLTILTVGRGRGYRLIIDRIKEEAAEFRRIIGEWRPDAILNDIMFHAGPIAAEAAGVPYATSVPCALPLSEGGLLYRSGFEAQSLSDLRGWLRHASAKVFRRSCDRIINSARKAHGLPSAPHPFLGLSSQLALVFSTEAFEAPRPGLGRHIHYIGASVSARRGDHAIPFPWDWLDGRPLVCVSLGTIFHGARSFFSRVVEVSRGQAWQMVVKISPGMDPASFHNRPENVLLVKEQPQIALLERAAVMVSHGGMGTVREALAAGVPQLIAPGPLDHETAADLAVASGVGLKASLARSPGSELRAAIRRLLEEPSFRAKAARIAADFARCDGAQAGAALIERLMETGMPVLRPEGRGPTVYVE